MKLIGMHSVYLAEEVVLDCILVGSMLVRICPVNIMVESQ